MFRASLRPSSEEQNCVSLPAVLWITLLLVKVKNYLNMNRRVRLRILKTRNT